MGLCCSAPVTDSEQQQTSARASDAQEYIPASQVKGIRNEAGGPQVYNVRDREQGKARSRASIEKGKPVLGRFEDVKEHYTFDKVLGKGQFGVTRLVVDTTTGEYCACKSISKRKLVSQEDMEDVRREIKVMHHLSEHPCVVNFKGGRWNQQLGSRK